MSHAKQIIAITFSIAAGAGLAFWLYRRSDQSTFMAGEASDADNSDSTSAGVSAGEQISVENLGYALVDSVTGWQARGAHYRDTIYAAAAHYGVPGDLLFRVAYQESRFRDDVINGTTPSPVGAQGMFQFMPATAASLGVDPLNVTSAANGAARYLNQLYRQFGTWSLALMAYNWGPGNVSKYLAGVKTPPTETKDYVAQITSDVSVA